MCGIVGAIAPSLVDSEINVFMQMLYTSALRGTDSTGVVVVRSHSSPKKQPMRYTLVKEAVPPAAFLSRHHSVLLNSGKGWSTNAIIGHCRAATVGKVSKENAHPFDIGNIVGCHNGTVYLKGGKEEQTDSEMLLTMINEKGIEEAVKELDNTGAYALVWFNKTEHTYHAIRNWQRPLHFVKTTSQVVFLASELKMLEWIIDRSSLTVAGKYEVIEPHTLYTWKVGSGELTPVKKEVKPPVRTYSVTQSRGPYGAWTWESYDNGFSRRDEFEDYVPRRHEPAQGQARTFTAPSSLPPERSNEGLVGVWDEVKHEYAYVSWKNVSWNTEANKFAHIPAPKQLTFEQGTDDKEDEDAGEIEELFCSLDNKVYTEDELWTLLGEGCSNCTRVPDMDEIIDNKNNIIIPIWTGDTGVEQYLCLSCAAIDKRHNHNH